MAGVPGETAAVGFWGGVKWSGFAFGGGASLSGFWFVGEDEIIAGWGGSRCWTGSDSGLRMLLGFPPVATGGGISSSLMGFPLLADVNMDCRVCVSEADRDYKLAPLTREAKKKEMSSASYLQSTVVSSNFARLSSSFGIRYGRLVHVNTLQQA